jgi:Stress responsive A/B Barrel Domain
MLIHTVFFWLKPELTAAQRTDFRRGVESLAAIKYVEKVYVGAPASTPDRPVIDKTYAVGLTVIFRDLAAHDAYQVDPIHLAFVAKFSGCWTRVQVYDAE